MVLELDPHVSLGGLVLDERVFEQQLRVGPLGVVLHQALLDKTVELLGPRRQDKNWEHCRSF